MPEQIDWNQIYYAATEHRLLSLLCEAFLHRDSVPIEIKTKAQEESFKELFVSENQMQEIVKLRDCFLKNGIDFLLLKGSKLKHLYPQHYMRPMLDADILIRTEQYEKIRPLVQSLGYTETAENEHELNWYKGFFHVELHECLIPPYDEDLYAYYGNGRKFAKKEEASSEYHFREEDNFVYLFTHFAKHYRYAGIAACCVGDAMVCAAVLLPRFYQKQAKTPESHRHGEYGFLPKRFAVCRVGLFLLISA